MKIIFTIFACVLTTLLLPFDSPGAGLTIVTHGFEMNSGSLDQNNNWVKALSDYIADRAGGGAAVYEMILDYNTITQKPVVSSFNLISGSPPNSSGNSEVIIRVYWNHVAGVWGFDIGDWLIPTEATTPDVAQAIEPFISGVITSSGLTHPFAELPIHLIGHSRGASVMSAVARILGEKGIWVDQITTIDPHPIQSDASITNYETILYADNYYQTGTFPGGQAVNGSDNRFLSLSPGAYTLTAGGGHSDTHLWYHGTVNTNHNANDGSVIFTDAFRGAWYWGVENAGQTAGFFYSRLGGGLSDDNGPFYGYYNEGDFNTSPANRQAIINRNSNEWPDLIQVAHDAASSVTAGNSFPLKYVFQSFDSACSVTLYLDTDQNPYNGNVTALTLTPSPDQSATARGTRTINAGGLVPTTTPAGSYYVYGKISNPYGIRYLYSLNKIQVLANGGGTGSIPTTTSVSPTSLPTSSSTQLLNIYGTNFKPSGDPNASTLIFHDPANIVYVRTPIYVSANQLQYYITVQSAINTWSVIVTNAGLAASNPQTFTVYTAAANTGSLVVNLSPAGATSAGAQWLLNGAYHNSGDVVASLTPGQYTVSFKSVSGYTTPGSATVTISANQQTTATGTYSAVAASTYALTINQSSGQGVINNVPTGTWNGSAYVYDSGATVQVTASANPGYHFVNWVGDASGTANPTTITMNGNKTVSANFASGDPNMGTITVTIQPPAAATAGVQWGWNSSDFRNSGTSYSTWPGSYFIVLHPVDGWIGPNANNLVAVTLVAGQTANYTYTFTQDTTPGYLVVTLTPQNAADAGAKWHVNGGIAQNSGATLALPVGTNYTITFDNGTNWTAPPSQTVTLQRGQTTIVSAAYTPPAGQPVIESIQPGIGPMSGGTPLTINGINFASPASVFIGGKLALNTVVASSTQITCTTPSNSIYGSTSVVVQTPSASTTNLNGFNYGTVNGNKIDLVSSVGGSCFGEAVSGTFAYIGEGRNLVVLNISSPSSPSKVGQVTLPGLVRGVALLGSFAYVADQEGGIQVVDISNPASPLIRGAYTTTNYTWIDGITIFGGRIYSASENDGLQIFDLSNPTVPTLLSSTNVGGGEAVIVQASANGVFAYISTGNNLCVVDVSNPLSPVLRGQTSMGNGGVYSIAMSGNYVYCPALWDFALHMVDVSNPDAPVDSKPSASGYGSYNLYAVTVANNNLYAASAWANGGLIVFNINGATLTKIGQVVNTAFSGYNMTVAGNYAYIAAGKTGFSIANVSNPYSPSISTTFTDSGLFGQYSAVAASGNTLCADLNGYPLFGDFKTLDITQPGSPSLVGQINNISESSQVLAQNGTAYLIGNGPDANQLSVRIINITTPSAPHLTLTISNTVSYNYKLALVGNMLFGAGENSSRNAPRFMATDVSNPSAPVIRSTRDFAFPNATGWSIAANGNKAVVGSIGATNILTMVDISNVSSPVERGSMYTTNGPVDIRISPDGKFAYYVTTAWPGFLYIANITNLANPFIVTNIPLDVSGTKCLEMRGNELFVGTYRGLYVFDISNSAVPVLIRSYSITGVNNISAPNDTVSHTGYIYVATVDGGIVTLKEQDIQAPNVYITSPTFLPVFTNNTLIQNLGGGSDDNVGVTQITWSNDRGGAGVVSAPFNNWVFNGISIYAGTNNIVVNAFDAAGNIGSDILTVVCQPPLQSQSINFPQIADHAFGDSAFLLSASASSGLPVSFNILSGPATISNNFITLTGVGAVTVRASQTGNNSFSGAPAVDVSFNIAKGTQFISSPALANKSADAAPFTIASTASSGLPVYFSVLSGPATINSNNLVTLLGYGTVTVSAWQTGNSNYNAATTIQGSFTVSGLPQFITFNPLSSQKFGDAPFQITATSSSGLPVGFSILSGPAQLSGNIITLTNWGSVVIRASQPGNNLYIAASNVDQSLTVLAPDTNKPTVTIISPLSNTRVSNAVVTVTGTAADNVKVASVWCSLNNGAWTYATGTTNWTNSLSFSPGTNLLQAYSVDTSGNSSLTMSVTLQYVVTNRLTVQAIGLGTISPNYSNSWLEIGRNYSITSAPASGFLATNWVVSTNWLGGATNNSKIVNFMMSSNLTLLAIFADVSLPTNTITAPTSGQHMTNALATIVGTTKDNWKVGGVWYQLNSNAWNLVTTTTNSYTNWTQTVTLMVGTNTLKAYAVDLGGNFSTTNSLSIVSSNTFKLQLAFTNSLPMKTNGLVFNLQLSTGLNGHIQVSTNLINWSTLTNFIGTNSTITFRDPAATNSSRRFYRAVIP